MPSFRQTLADAYPDTPDEWRGEAKEDVLLALRGFLAEVQRAREYYHSGQLDAPANGRARSAAYTEVQLAGRETDAIFRIMRMCGGIILNAAEKAGVDSEDLVADAFDAVRYSLCGWGQECSLTSWLKRNLPEAFRVVGGGQTREEMPGVVEETPERPDTPAWQLADPVEWAERLTKHAPDLRRIWAECLTPTPASQ